MPKTEAEKRANKKYLAKLETIYLRLPPEEKAEILAHATSKSESVNSFVRRAVKETIIKETTE